MNTYLKVIILLLALGGFIWLFIWAVKGAARERKELDESNNKTIRDWLDRHTRHDSLSNEFIDRQDVVRLIKILRPYIDID